MRASVSRTFQHFRIQDVSTTNSGDGQRHSSNGQEEEMQEDELFLSLFYSCNNIGAAIYNVADGALSLMNDMVDPGPKHKLVLSILSQLNPKHLLISPRHAEIFGKAAKSLGGMDTTFSSSNALQTSLSHSSFVTSLEQDSASRVGKATDAISSSIHETFHNINVVTLPGKVSLTLAS